MPGVKANVQARLDRRSQIALERLVRRLGWSPSRVVREGVHLLAACYVGPRPNASSAWGDLPRAFLISVRIKNTYKGSASEAGAGRYRRYRGTSGPKRKVHARCATFWGARNGRGGPPRQYRRNLLPVAWIPGAPEAALRMLSAQSFRSRFISPAPPRPFEPSRRDRDLPADFADACLIHLATN